MSGLQIDAALRQFARAVTADRFVGDELVNAILSRADGAAPDNQSRAASFNLFLHEWRALAVPGKRRRAFSAAQFVCGAGALPGEGRLAVLLSDVCQLTPAEIDEALGEASMPATELVAAERAAIRARKFDATAVIIEDEPLIAADLNELLSAMGVGVAALARTADQAISETLKRRPDIILADFNLEGSKTGVDAICAIQSEHQCPVVFITGYPDQVLTGDEVEPDFVLAKPYAPDSVRAAVAQCLDTARFSSIKSDEGEALKV